MGTELTEEECIAIALMFGPSRLYAPGNTLEEFYEFIRKQFPRERAQELLRMGSVYTQYDNWCYRQNLTCR